MSSQIQLCWHASYSYCARSWQQQLNLSLEKNFHQVENVIKTIVSYISCVFIEIWSTWEVWRALKKQELLSATPRATLTCLSCSPNFPRASYLDKCMLMYEPIVKYYIIVFSAFLGNLGKSVLLSVWFLVSGVPDPCQLCVTDIYSDDLLPVMCWGRRRSLHFGG